MNSIDVQIHKYKKYRGMNVILQFVTIHTSYKNNFRFLVLKEFKTSH